MPTLSIDTEVAIPMPDGVRLAAHLFRPARAGRYPAVVVRTPYDRRTPASTALQVNALALAAAGYAVVVQDVRGRGGSGGGFAPFVAEAADGAATIEWAATQGWCNGRVGTAGISYLAFAQLAAAAAGPEPLQAWVPGLSPLDVRTSWIRDQGAFNRGFDLAWALALASTDPQRLSDAAARGYEEAERTVATPDEDLADALPGFYTDWQVQIDPYPDRATVPGAGALGAVAAPALVIPGWFDLFAAGSFDLFSALEAEAGGHPHRLLAGPWGHSGLPLGRRAGDADFGAAAMVDLHQVQLSWFDLHLRDSGEVPAAAQVFVTGADRWQSFGTWPAPAVRQRWHPEANGLLEPGPPEPTEVVRVVDPTDPTPTVGGRVFGWEPVLRPGVFDQTRRQQRPDVATFTSGPIDADLTLLGPVDVSLAVAGGGDVAVMLSEVDGEGRAWNVTDGVARMGDGPTTSVSLGHVAHVAPAGHRLRLDVAYASFPRLARPTPGERHLALGLDTYVDLPVAS